MVCSLVSIYFDSHQLEYNENKMYKTLDYWSRNMLNLDFLEKGMKIVSPPHIVYGFSRKMFLMLYSINWPNLFVWLPLFFEILGITIPQINQKILIIHMCITIFCFPGCNCIVFISPFFYMIKKPRQKLKYLENKKSF